MKEAASGPSTHRPCRVTAAARTRRLAADLEGRRCREAAGADERAATVSCQERSALASRVAAVAKESTNDLLFSLLIERKMLN